MAYVHGHEHKHDDSSATCVPRRVSNWYCFTSYCFCRWKIGKRTWATIAPAKPKRSNNCIGILLPIRAHSNAHNTTHTHTLESPLREWEWEWREEVETMECVNVQVNVRHVLRDGMCEYANIHLIFLSFSLKMRRTKNKKSAAEAHWRHSSGCGSSHKHFSNSF